MIPYDALPTLNAVLNGIATVLLLIAWTFIRQKKIQQHRNTMLTAFAVSVLFLISYVVYHAHAKIVYFQHQGAIKMLYLIVLWTHIPLAAAVPVLALITINRGLKMQVQRHRAIARWTLPIWLYVSVTGVVVYLMLYHL
jgi:uncharacterized membrane protein YozB (DUF420 family)